MNCLDKLTKDIKCRQRKQRINCHPSLVLGAAIGVSIMIVLGQSCCKLIMNVKDIDEDLDKDIDEDLDKDIDEDLNIIRDEIKQTLEKVDDESIGDVGVAIEKALEDL